MTVILLVTLSVFINATGQVLLKKATIHIKSKYVYLICGYSLFVISVFITKLLIDKIDFKNMALVVTFNLIGVMLGSVLFLGEPLTKRKITGTAMVMVGTIIFLDSSFFIKIFA
jgi:drug/metabolite transporter (DMT)-like permease